MPSTGLRRHRPFHSASEGHGVRRAGRPCAAYVLEDLWLVPRSCVRACGACRLASSRPIVLAFGLACSGDAPPTAPDFAKGGISTVTVTSLADDGSVGTLRWAITNATAGAAVTFSSTLCAPGATPATGCTITLDPGLGALTINKNLQITGPTSYTLAVNGNNAAQVLAVAAPATVTVKNLTVSRGFTTDGGNGIINTGTLTLTNCTVSGNTVGGDFGGGIFNNGGTLTLNSSTVSDNSGPGSSGGGIANNGGTLTLNNSVVSGNTADFNGGGLDNGGTLTARNSTVSGNTAGNTGGGIFNVNFGGTGGTMTLTSTVVNRNSAPMPAAASSDAGTHKAPLPR